VSEPLNQRPISGVWLPIVTPFLGGAADFDSHEVFERMAANDQHNARAVRSRLKPATRILFKEPNPMAIKHWLSRQGAVSSANPLPSY
jgi:hypothetical protein